MGSHHGKNGCKKSRDTLPLGCKYFYFFYIVSGIYGIKEVSVEMVSIMLQARNESVFDSNSNDLSVWEECLVSQRFSAWQGS